MEGDFRIGEWLVQPQIGAITRGDKTVHLEPKMMEVLVYLAGHTEEVLPKERIIHAVWGDTFVTDEVLTNAISELRRAFGDDAKDPHTIQTLPRLGYRLIATVTPTERDHPEVATPASRQLWQQSVLVVLATVSLLAFVFILWWSWPASSDEPIDSIAVLPFVNISGDEDSESLCDGIPGSISSSLSRLPQLRVKSTTILQRYRGLEVDPLVVSNEQGVSAVLIGSVERRDHAFLVAVELINGLDNTLLWSQRYIREITDIFALEEDIARQVAEALRLQLTSEEEGRLAHTGTRNPEAYQAFLKGEYHTGSWEKRIPYYKRAIELDPGYQEAYQKLGVLFFQIARTQTSEKDYSRAKASWEKVIELDESAALAHYCKAWILWSYEHRWKEAEQEYRRWAELGSPLVAEALEREGYFQFLEWIGSPDAYLSMMEEDLKRSDPLSAFQQGKIGYQFLHHREYDRTIEQANKRLELAPESGDTFYLFEESYYQKGMLVEAFDSALRSQKYWGRTEEELAAMRQAFEESGMEGVWRLVLEDRLKQPSPRPISVASLYAKIGEKDLAFEWLEKTWSYPLMGYETAPSSQNHDPLRDDSRFEQLLRKLNLPEEAIQRHIAAPGGTPSGL